MSNNKNNKRQKQNIHVSPRIIIPSGDFTIEIIMSIALLKFIITEDFTILELDETNSNFDTLLNAYKHSPNTYIIGLGGEYIPQQLTFHWSSSSSSLMNKKKIKNKNKNLQINNYFNDSKRAKIVPLSTVGLIYKLFGKQIIMNITNFKDSAKINWLYERAYFDFIEIIDAYIRKFNLHYNNNENNENLIPRFNDELQKLPSFVKYFNLQLIDYEKYKIKEELFKIKLIKINKFCIFIFKW
ncbi:hypothetical protein C6P40_004038 [Pichia californica]|uniref:Uncharacterized protein n=1 Tax=Pichia californica TaxID=460514 RepID=A0A9P6WQH5_9ASCO|nr:hypothetical protein C6P40_004038 [[Candida] californica]